MTQLFVFIQEPNPEDPLNKEAAEVLQNNRRLFEQNVQKAMRGGYVGSVYFERCLKWYVLRIKQTTPRQLMADKILPQEIATYFFEVEGSLFQPLWDATCKQDCICAYNLLYT